MTQASSTTRVRQDSDAAYQEWRDEFITKLGALVTGGFLAADETNITAGVGGRTINTEQGYAVYHLADSLHGTAPVYIRFGFGAGAAVNVPRLQATTGTSTNGSGVLGGTALATITGFAANNAGQSTDTTRNSYWSCVAGFLGISWKQGSSASGSFFICRTCDSAGAISATAAQVYWGAGAAAGATKTQAFRYASTAAAYTSQNGVAQMALCFNPQFPAATLVGSNSQAFVCWTITPQVAPLFAVCGVLDSEYTTGTTFSVAMVGSTPRTFIALDTTTPVGPGPASTTGYPKMAMIWET